MRSGAVRNGRSRWTSLPGIAVSIALGCSLLVACGSEVDDGAAPEPKPLSAADLELIRAAVQTVRAAATGTYVVTQSAQEAEGGRTQVLVTRRGSYDRDDGLHQVEVVAAGQGGAEPISLTFLTSRTDVLMRNPTFTQQHGKTWTRLPSEEVEALYGQDLATAEVEPPALDVAVAAQLPGQVLSDKPGITSYEVDVPQAAALELVANAGAVKMSQLTGIPVDELAEAFTGTMPVTVVLSDGRLKSLSADLSPLLKRAAEVAAEPMGDLGTSSLLVQVSWQPGGPVDIQLPAADDVADAPS